MSLSKDIEDAVKSGDLDMLQLQLHEHVAIVNEHFDDGRTMLIVSIQENKSEITQHLLKCGAEVNIFWQKECVNRWAPKYRSIDRIYPLQVAVECKAEWAILLLLNHGATADQAKGGLNQLLLQAVRWNSIDIVKKLIETVKEDDEYGCSNVTQMASFAPMLMAAVHDRNLAMVDLLVNLGVSVNTVHENMLPLTLAAKFNDLRLCQCLLNHGACLVNDIQTQAYMPNPLALAVQAGWDQAVEFLVRFGADPNCSVTWNNMVYAKDILDSGSRILHLAVAKHSLTIVQILVEKKADISMTDSSGNNPLHVTCKDTEMPSKIIEYLINPGDHIKSNKCYLNAKNKEGMTPLMLACKIGHSDAVNILLRNDVNIDVIDIKKRTALYYAVLNGQESIVLKLLQSGANVNSGKKCSLVQAAIKAGNETITEILLEEGADYSNIGFHNSLHQAAESNNPYLVEMFLNKGINVNIVNNSGETPLMIASRTCEDGRAVQTLIDHGAIINWKQKHQGETPLSTAVFFGRTENAHILIREGANVHHKDKRFKNICPVYRSVYNNQVETLQLLLHAGAKFTLQDIASNKYPKTMSLMRNFELIRWIVNFVTGLPNLQTICVRIIRRKLQRRTTQYGISKMVKQLPVPERLKQAIMLEDIELYSFDEEEEEDEY